MTSSDQIAGILSCVLIVILLPCVGCYLWYHVRESRMNHFYVDSNNNQDEVESVITFVSNDDDLSEGDETSDDCMEVKPNGDSEVNV